MLLSFGFFVLVGATLSLLLWTGYELFFVNQDDPLADQVSQAACKEKGDEATAIDGEQVNATDLGENDGEGTKKSQRRYVAWSQADGGPDGRQQHVHLKLVWKCPQRHVERNLGPTEHVSQSLLRAESGQHGEVMRKVGQGLAAGKELLRRQVGKEQPCRQHRQNS